MTTFRVFFPRGQMYFAFLEVISCRGQKSSRAPEVFWSHGQMYLALA